MPTPAERQRAFVGLATLSRRELVALWRKLNLGDPERLREPVAQIIADIVDRYGAAAASLAADLYDENRNDSGAPGSFRALTAPPVPAERTESLARWGLGPLFSANPDGAKALSLLGGGLQRIVLDQGRETTALSVSQDPAGPTYARHASANACTFCRLLATRSATYRTAESAEYVVGRGTDAATNLVRTVGRKALGVKTRGAQALGDKYHDYCKCTVIEVFPDQQYEEAPYVQQWRDSYKAAVRSLGAPGQTGLSYDEGLTKTLAHMRDAMGSA